MNFGSMGKGNQKEKRIGIPFASSVLKPGFEYFNFMESLRSRSETDGQKMVCLFA